LGDQVIMSLLDKLKAIFKEDARKRAYVFIRHDHTENATFDDKPLQAGKHYFRLWLSEMFLDKRVDWFREWYPMAHTLVSFQFGDQNLQVPHVAGASQLKGVTEESLNRMVSLNYQLTTLMPFNGGVVEVIAALVAMKGKDYIGSVVKVLGDLSQLLVVPQLSTALGVALPIASGVQDLIGGGSGKMQLGMHQAFVGEGGTGVNVLKPGYFAVIDGNAEDYSESTFWVKEGRLYQGTDMASSKLFETASHLLFQVEVRDQRDDWTSLKNIQDAYQESLRQLGEGESEKADLAIKRAIVLARTSPDLTRADRNRVALAIKEDFDQAKGGGLGAVPRRGSTLESVIDRRAISVDAAFDEDPRWETLLS
jgi:hypothetical protein